VQNLDKPGVICFIGTTLGDFQVNIANMHPSCSAERDPALAIIRLDEMVPGEYLNALLSFPNILSVQ
jgi:D-3-phosphoglycerate dehydrogenase / 2-oxoglutarate reductase